MAVFILGPVGSADLMRACGAEVLLKQRGNVIIGMGAGGVGPLGGADKLTRYMDTFKAEQHS